MDWSAIRARVESAMEGVEHSAPRRAAVLRERAAQLSQALPDPGTPEAGVTILIFNAAGSRYALAVDSVTEVIGHAAPSPVPGAPPEIAGLIQIRGTVCPVYRLGRLLSVDSRGRDGDTVLLVKAGMRQAGLLIDGIEEIRTVGSADRTPPPTGATNVLWMTRDLASILDLRSLFHKEERWRT